MTTSTYHGERPIPRATVREVCALLGYDADHALEVTLTAHHVEVTLGDGRSRTVHTHPIAPWQHLAGSDHPALGAEPEADEVETRTGSLPW